MDGTAVGGGPTLMLIKRARTNGGGVGIAVLPTCNHSGTDPCGAEGGCWGEGSCLRRRARVRMSEAVAELRWGSAYKGDVIAHFCAGVGAWKGLGCA